MSQDLSYIGDAIWLDSSLPPSPTFFISINQACNLPRKVLKMCYCVTSAIRNDLSTCLDLQQHMKKVLDLAPDDVEAWIELAQILEQTDVQVSGA